MEVSIQASGPGRLWWREVQSESSSRRQETASCIQTAEGGGGTWGRCLCRRMQNAIIKWGLIFPVMKGHWRACCLPILFQELHKLLYIHLIFLKDTIKLWPSLSHRWWRSCSARWWWLRVACEKMASAQVNDLSSQPHRWPMLEEVTSVRRERTGLLERLGHPFKSCRNKPRQKGWRPALGTVTRNQSYLETKQVQSGKQVKRTQRHPAWERENTFSAYAPSPNQSISKAALGTLCSNGGHTF